jgi:hypothetical protein
MGGSRSQAIKSPCFLFCQWVFQWVFQWVSLLTPENGLNKFIFLFSLTFIIFFFGLTNSFIYFVKLNLLHKFIFILQGENWSGFGIRFKFRWDLDYGMGWLMLAG